MKLLSTFACLLSIASTAYAAFGVTNTGSNYVVNTNGGLVFSVSKSTGDIVSLLYNGTQCQDSSKMSHIGSGLRSRNVAASTINSQYIKITVTTPTLTQYYIAKSGDPIIYMATYITAEPTIGELRFIARLKKSAVPNGVAASEVHGGSVVEGSDVFLVNGQARSKFYSSKAFIDDQVHCVNGSGIGVCMVIPDTSYESSSGGPFFRDIDNQGTTQQELYFYMNSNHVKTEAYRMGLHGPYAMVFTSGGTASSSLNFSFFSQLGITGFVPKSSRGYVSGTVSGVSSDGVVHWYNDAAQYWIKSTGPFTSPAMKPGTYTMVLYKGELKVQTVTGVTVSAGATTYCSIASAESVPSSLVFRIGITDGRPTGFKNAANQLFMHPSDSRMSSWAPVTVTWGSMSTADFPMAQIKSINDPTIINVSLSNTTARTLRIFTTLSFAGGRPSVKVNSYSPAVPGAPVKIDSRGFTRGAFRGHGEVYTFSIPSSALVTGVNTIQISCVSGSSNTGFLNPNFIYDAVEFY
ncbi:rhamnogalacturonate lyase A [Terfezia boudieri ATCC MYA-4762]|uniref:rhamnogalacturonan endolyase n=1 Tax=Terfezia boudieri ATCC MYA-4762 TaxID=1051890 RepID=A0A3N4LP71_9PEZI|nr:rhamnogalacturonate lyase A [Terfezia boudieri ATCC MYA-4762]